MAKHNSPMRLNKQLVAEAQLIAANMNRTAAEQIEYWSEIGKRVSAQLSERGIIQIMTGVGEISLSAPQPKPFDPMELAEHVNKDTTLEADLLAQNQTLYSPAPEGGGILTAKFPDGTVKKGRVENGQFKPLRKREVA